MGKTTYDYGMMFEFLLCQVLGEKVGYQKVSYINNFTKVRKYLFKVIDKFVKRVDEIDMDERLREQLFNDFDYFKKELKETNKNLEKLDLIIILLMIISKLLGYDWSNGGIFRTPVYVRTIGNMATDEAFKKSGGYYNRELTKIRKNLVKRRNKIIRKLKKDGLKTPEIAFIFKTTDYEIKKNLKNIEKIELN